MFLFKLAQTVNPGYDTYSDAVVVAETADAARLIHPHACGEVTWDPAFVEYPGAVIGRWVQHDGVGAYDHGFGTWAHPAQVVVTRLGVATNPNLRAGEVVTASYHAG